MPNYYDRKLINDSKIYEQYFKDRGRKIVEQFATKTFDQFQNVSFSAYTHYWSSGDTLRNISIKFYNGPGYWWVIGFANGKPTDAHYTIGDTVLVPANPRVLIR